MSRITVFVMGPPACREFSACVVWLARLAIEELADSDEAKVGKEAQDWEVTRASHVSHTLRTIESWTVSFEVSAPFVAVECYDSMGMIGAPLAGKFFRP